MGNITVDIATPSYWQDFEKLTLEMAKLKWKDDYAERNGRQGQSQAGVDIYGYNHNQKEQTGIQCKKRITKTRPGSDSPSYTLTTTEIDAEILAATGFSPKLDRYIIATTGPRHEPLLEHVRTLNCSSQPFKIALWFWDDYVDALNEHPELMYRYYEHVLKFRKEYNPLQHYLLMLAMAFDRPALRTPFCCENRADDFIQAIADTQQAISTGCLHDRQGRIVDQAPIPRPKLQNLKVAARKLASTRDLATKSLANEIIVQHAEMLEIRDPSVVSSLNALRSEAINLLNATLRDNNLQEVVLDEFRL